MKKYDYKSKMNQNRKRFAKRVGSLALVTTLAISTPVVPNVISESGFQNVLSSSVVHAATENQGKLRDIDKPVHGSYEYTQQTNYRIGVHIEFPDYENSEEYKITWKIPEEFATNLDNNEYLELIKKGAFLSGSYLDEDGERVSSADYEHEKYVTVDPSNRTIEYDLSSLLEEHNLELYDDLAGGVPHLLASAQIYTDLHDVAEGNYSFKLAVTNGSVDPEDVGDAFEIDYEVNYEKYDNGDIKPDPTEPEPEDPEVDKADLEAKVAEVDDLDEADYTEASWKELQDAVKASQAVNDNEDAKQDEVDASLAALTAAYEGLEEAEEPTDPVDPDKSDLEAKIGEVEDANLVESDFTEASWKVLQDTLTSAQAVVDKEGATEDEVDTSLAALTAAYEELEKAEKSDPVEVDKADLEAKLAEIDNANLDEADYTEASWKAFQESLRAAQEIVSNEDITQKLVDESLVALTTDYEKLKKADKENPLNIKDLEIGINTAFAYNPDDYTDESYAPLFAAAEAGDEVLADARAEEVTQEEIDAALAKINNAIDGLVKVDPEKSVDKSILTDGIKAIKLENLVEADYTKASWKTFQDALTAAESVVSDENATQDEVSASAAVLNSAFVGLKAIEEPTPEEPEATDLSALEKKLEQIMADSLAETDYTEASWKALQEALAAAQSVLSGDDATQDEIDEALATLIAAFEGLKAVEEPTPEEPEEPEEDEVVVEVEDESEDDETTAGEVDTDSDHSNTLPATATSTFNWMLGGLIAMFAGGLGLFTRKGRKNSKDSSK